MKRVAALLMMFVVAAAVAQAAEPNESPIFDVPRMEKVAIDGNAVDWGDGGFRIDLLVPPDGPIRKASDHLSTARLAWNDKGLLILLTVHDDKWVEGPRIEELWRGDGVEVFLAPKLAAADVCQWCVAPGMMDDQPKARWFLHDFRKDESLKKLPAELTVARSKIEGGYVMEILAPWGALGIEAKAGVEAALQMFIDDVDDGLTNYAYHAAWYPGVGTGYYHDRMHRIRLADKPSPPFVATARADIDLTKLAPRLTVIATAALAGQEASAVLGDKTLVSAKLAVAETGLATVTMPLPAPAAGKAYEDLQARLGGQLVRTLSVADSGLLGEAQALLAQKDRLVKDYGLDRPWDPMADAPAIVRKHRGLVAWAVDMLGRSQRGQDFNLQNLCDMAGIVARLDKGEDYLATARNSFWCAYLSAADGSGQPFAIRVPADLDANVAAPLYVSLHGMTTRPRPDANAVVKGQMIWVNPWGRGDLGYCGLGENDVLEVIRCVRQMYNIDANRIYLGGTSMGGFGTWEMACRHPDLFAAVSPNCGGGAELPLENLRNVPLFNQHGMADWSVSIDLSRVAVARLADLGYCVVHKEYPGGDHNYRPTYNVTSWMLQFARPQRPACVTLTCPSPARGTAYWASVKRMADPHRPATIRAQASGFGEHQALTLDLHNVDVLELDTTSMPLDPNAGLQVQCGLSLLTAKAPLPAKLYVLAGDGNATLGDKWQEPAQDARPFAAGAAAELFTGEPLLIVYGSSGTPEANSLLKATAERLACYGGPGREMASGRIPIKADRDVAEIDLTRYNLILLGRPADNCITARVAGKLPLRVDEKNRLLAGGRAALGLDATTLRMIHYNPLATQRLVYMVWVNAAEVKDANAFAQNARNLLENGWGGDRVNSPDLVVRTLDGTQLRRMQFTHGWQWRPIAGADTSVPAACADPNWIPRELARLLQRNCQADYGLFWAPDSKEKPSFDPNVFTMADFATDDGPQESLVGEVTGEELIEIHKLFLVTRRMFVSPEIDPAAIKPDRLYRLAMPPWLPGDLKERHKNLRNVRPGPDISASAIRAEMLRAAQGTAAPATQKERP